MAPNASRESANVTTSAPKVNVSPPPAIRMPATAGPTIMPAVDSSSPMAFAAVTSSRSTSRGISASIAGRWIPPSAAITPATTKISHTWASGKLAFTIKTIEHRPSAASAPRIKRRRSMASARAPPTKASESRHASSTAPRSPTASDDRVRLNTW